MKIIKPLIIATVGPKDSGKTTALSFIAEILADDLGLTELYTYDFRDKSKVPIEDYIRPEIETVFISGSNTGILHLKEPAIILVDGAESCEAKDKIKKLNSITLLVRRFGNEIYNGYHPTFVTHNYGSFRRFKFDLKSLIISEFPQNKNWKESIIV